MIKELRKLFLKNRVKVLLDIFDLKDCSVLDLGGYDGRYMDYIKEKCPNIKVTIADQDIKGLDISKKKGYDTVILDGAKQMPFYNKQFDMVFCNSVIEHVTVPKDQVWNFKTDLEFKEKSFSVQKHFASEISRIAKGYFVQTPNRYFFIEHHSWLPFVQFFPRKILMKLLRFTNKFWIKKTEPDWNLLSEHQLQELFPDAKVSHEKFFFMKKSIIAYKKQ